MRKLIAVLCLVGISVLVAAPLQAATKVMRIYPHQLKDWASSSSATFSFEGEFLHAPLGQLFVYPVKLPVGATVIRLDVWVYPRDEGAYASLVRVRDGYDYDHHTDDVASVDLNAAAHFTWTQLADTADGPAPPRIAAGYRYYLHVYPNDAKVGTIQITYKTP